MKLTPVSPSYKNLRNTGIPWTPKEYQIRGVSWFLENDNGALFLRPGAGKTSATLAAIKCLKELGKVKKILLIAPLRVGELVWTEECKKWVDFNGFSIVQLHGPKKDRLLEKTYDIYIVNPEGLPWLVGTDLTAIMQRKRFKGFGFDLLVIDELSRFKNCSIKSQRYKLLKGVHDLVPVRWGLTGSPAANGLTDLFGQCFIIDRGRTFGRYKTHFLKEYFIPDYMGWKWALKPGAEDRIYKKLASFAMMLSDDDYNKLPEIVYNDIEVYLPDEALEFYKKFELFLVACFQGDVVSATNVAVASGKCRQIASGAIYKTGTNDPLCVADDYFNMPLPSSTREWKLVHNAKLDALVSLIEELQGEPLLVAYEFKHDLERIQKRLGKDIPFIGSGVSIKQSAEIEKAWNAGQIPVLLGHPQAMGHGLNLQGAGNNICWFSLTFNYELYDQFNYRVRRQGNKHESVFIHHLLAKGTIDSIVLRALQNKEKTQDALFNALKGYQNVE